MSHVRLIALHAALAVKFWGWLGVSLISGLDDEELEDDIVGGLTSTVALAE